MTSESEETAQISAILYTTVVIAKHDKTGVVKAFDLGNMELPSSQYTPTNAYTCTKGEAKKLKK